MTRDYLLEEDEPFNEKRSEHSEQWNRLPDGREDAMAVRQPRMSAPVQLPCDARHNLRYNSRHSVAFLLTRQIKTDKRTRS